MVDCRSFDAGAEVVLDLPGDQQHRHPTVCQFETARRCGVLDGKVKHVGVEFRQTFRLDDLQREVLEPGRLLPLAALIDFGAVRHALLRQIEVIAGGIVDAMPANGRLLGRWMIPMFG